MSDVIDTQNISPTRTAGATGSNEDGAEAPRQGLEASLNAVGPEGVQRQAQATAPGDGFDRIEAASLSPGPGGNQPPTNRAPGPGLGAEQKDRFAPTGNLDERISQIQQIRTKSVGDAWSPETEQSFRDLARKNPAEFDKTYKDHLRFQREWSDHIRSLPVLDRYKWPSNPGIRIPNPNGNIF